MQKCKLADADFREALLKAKLCRIRARHAKHVLDAANVYAHHVKWTILQSKYGDVYSKAVTVAGTKGTQTISTSMRAAEHTPPSKLLR